MNIDNNDFQLEKVIDYIEQIINEKKDLLEKIDKFKENEELTEKLLEENSMLNKIIKEIRNFFDIESDNSELDAIIDFIKQSINNKENQLKKFEENQSKIENNTDNDIYFFIFVV